MNAAAAHPDGWIAVGIIAIVYGSITLVLLPTILTVTLTRHFRRVQARRLGSELIHEMLQRKMQPDEIERILALWTEDRRLAKKVLGEHGFGKGFAIAKAS